MHSFSYKAIENTLESRHTVITGIPIVFTEKFWNDKMKQQQWAAFIRKTRIEKVKKEFSEVMKRITDFLKPMAVSFMEKDRTSMERWWNSEKGIWVK